MTNYDLPRCTPEELGLSSAQVARCVQALNHDLTTMNGLMMARNGKVLLLSDAAGIETAGQGTWKTLTLPTVEPIWAPILYAVPAQLLAYHTAIAKGTDVDQPRNLAKSVTVE